MSGPVIAGIVMVGLAAVASGWSARYFMRADEASRRKHAARFAKPAGIVVPAELVGWTGDRARRRLLAGLTVTTPLMMLMVFATGYFGWRAVGGALTSGRAEPMPMALPLVLPWTMLLAVAVVE